MTQRHLGEGAGALTAGRTSSGQIDGRGAPTSSASRAYSPENALSGSCFTSAGTQIARSGRSAGGQPRVPVMTTLLDLAPDATQPPSCTHILRDRFRPIPTDAYADVYASPYVSQQSPWLFYTYVARLHVGLLTQCGTQSGASFGRKYPSTFAAMQAQRWPAGSSAKHASLLLPSQRHQFTPVCMPLLRLQFRGSRGCTPVARRVRQ